MVTILLPIPAPPKTFQPFFIPFDISEGNKYFESKHKGIDTLRKYRQEVQDKFNIPKGSYVSTLVKHNTIEAIHNSATTLDDTVGDNARTSGEHWLYQIDPDLKPTLPDENLANDGLYNISDEFTMCVVDLKLVKATKSGNSFTRKDK